MTPDQKFMIKKAIADNDISTNWDNIYIPLYGKGWRSPQTISLKSLINQLTEIIKVKPSPDPKPEKPEKPVREIPKPPPGAKLKETFIATDENYLYAFINNKWKRTSLSNW